MAPPSLCLHCVSGLIEPLEGFPHCLAKWRNDISEFAARFIAAVGPIGEERPRPTAGDKRIVSRVFRPERLKFRECYCKGRGKMEHPVPSLCHFRKEPEEIIKRYIFPAQDIVLPRPPIIHCSD